MLMMMVSAARSGGQKKTGPDVVLAFVRMMFWAPLDEDETVGRGGEGFDAGDAMSDFWDCIVEIGARRREDAKVLWKKCDVCASLRDECKIRVVKMSYVDGGGQVV